MAVIVYQCDTCKREIHRKQNKKGIDVIGRCIITNGCRGKLSLQSIKPSYAVGHSTPPVIGLVDWTPRKVLYTHSQTILKTTWQIHHNLNTHPSVSIYVYKNTGDQEVLAEAAPESIEYTSNDIVTVVLKNAATGIVQCQSRSASDGQNITTLLPKTSTVVDSTVFSISRSYGLTNGLETGELTVATRVSTVATSGFSPTQEINLHINFLSAADLSPISIPVTLTLRAMNNTPVNQTASPWAGTGYGVIAGHKYLVRSVNIHSIGNLTTLGIPQGSPYFFTVSYLGSPRPLSNGEILILNAINPYSAADRDYGHVTDMSKITQQNASAMTAYVEGELTANTAALDTIFPNVVLL